MTVTTSAYLDALDWLTLQRLADKFLANHGEALDRAPVTPPAFRPPGLSLTRFTDCGWIRSDCLAQRGTRRPTARTRLSTKLSPWRPPLPLLEPNELRAAKTRWLASTASSSDKGNSPSGIAEGGPKFGDPAKRVKLLIYMWDCRIGRYSPPR